MNYQQRFVKIRPDIRNAMFFIAKELNIDSKPKKFVGDEYGYVLSSHIEDTNLLFIIAKLRDGEDDGYPDSGNIILSASDSNGLLLNLIPENYTPTVFASFDENEAWNEKIRILQDQIPLFLNRLKTNFFIH